MTKQIVTSYKIIDGKFHLYTLDGVQVDSHNAIWEGDFDCSKRKLPSLDGLQGCTFGGGFDCGENKLKNLHGLQGCTFGSWFDCSFNNLTSLHGIEGCTFGDEFYYGGNNLPDDIEFPPTKQDVTEKLREAGIGE